MFQRVADISDWVSSQHPRLLARKAASLIYYPIYARLEFHALSKVLNFVWKSALPPAPAAANVRPPMLRFKFSGAFLVLLMATFCLWQFRFARNPDYPTLTLGDLKPSATLCPGATWTGTATQPELLLRSTESAKGVVQRISLPHLPPTRWLHLRFHLHAAQLKPGPQPWCDGRLILEWHTGANSLNFDPLGSVREDRDTGEVSLVARPNHGAATPTLRLENLAASGDFHILTFEATVVEERALWKYGKWLLLLAWAAWFSAATGLATSPRRLRPLAAAIVWLLMAVTFSFPGPWKTQRPLTAPFQIGPELRQIADPHPATNPAPAATPTPPPPTSAGRIPPQGSALVLLKDFIHQHCPSLKSFYHIPLLFAPTLLSLLLISRRRSLLLGGFTAVAIEAAQLAFGYSLDWMDALDVTCDALGILLACRAHRWLTTSVYPTAPATHRGSHAPATATAAARRNPRRPPHTPAPS